jgi:hypothetical protein
MDRDAATLEVEFDGSRPRWRRRLSLGVALLAIVVALGVGTRWWWHGGTFLHAVGNINGAENAPNELSSVAIQLETSSGRSVTLDRVSAAQPNGAQVTWSIYKSAPGGDAFGPVRGALAPTWPTVPVHGYRVAQPAGHPERGATWLVGSMRAARPGVYLLDHIKITYHSGLRTRHASTDTSLCLLVYPPARKALIVQQAFSYDPNSAAADTVDPLVAQYATCTDPALQR